MKNHYSTPTQKLNFILNSIDLYQKKVYPLLIYLGYITDTLYNDEIISIGNNNYPKEKLRNSFVHGRLFIGTNSKIELYYGPSGNKNYYNFDWHQSINIYDLKNWSEQFYKQNTNYLKRK